MTREDDLYRALGLERTASQEEIRKAYKTTGAFYLRKKNFVSRRVFLHPKERCLSSCARRKRAPKTRSRFYFRAQRRALLTREHFIFSLFLHHHPLNRSFEKPPG